MVIRKPKPTKTQTSENKINVYFVMTKKQVREGIWLTVPDHSLSLEEVRTGTLQGRKDPRGRS